MHPRYIAIEGPIGAGKTSLARRLAQDLSAQLLLESPDENPFLPLFYDEPERYALATQLSFLLSRHHQLNTLHELALDQAIVSDYSFVKDLVFAALNLSDVELKLYHTLRERLLGPQLRPDLIVYLEAEPETLKKHVKMRNAAYEKKISFDYLEAVLEAYNKFFFEFNETQVLMVNATHIDFVNNEEHYQTLFREILGEKRGQRHYVSIA